MRRCVQCRAPVDRGPPGPSVRGTLQARILEWGPPWWLSGERIRLPMQGTWVRAPIGEDSQLPGSRYSPDAERAAEPGSCNY